MISTADPKFEPCYPSHCIDPIFILCCHITRLEKSSNMETYDVAIMLGSFGWNFAQKMRFECPAVLAVWLLIQKSETCSLINPVNIKTSSYYHDIPCAHNINTFPRLFVVHTHCTITTRRHKFGTVVVIVHCECLVLFVRVGRCRQSVASSALVSRFI